MSVVGIKDKNNELTNKLVKPFAPFSNDLFGMTSVNSMNNKLVIKCMHFEELRTKITILKYTK
jgi:hypothetical protein